MIDLNESGALQVLNVFKGVRPLVELMEWTPNQQFSYTDSATLAAVVKAWEPRKVIEIGCGFSTAIIRQALHGDLICIDPEPRNDIRDLADAWIEKRVEHTPTEIFEALGARDILFIDSSHRVLQGGDLPFLFFEVLPRLRPGVFIHFHDIFLPDDYPPGWAPRGYGEQYLLRALLEGSEDYGVMYPGYFMATRHPEEVKDALGDNRSSGSFWLIKES